MFDPDTNEIRDVSAEFDNWQPYRGTTFDGKPVFVTRIDEDFVWVGQLRNMAYKAGDYVAITGSMDTGFALWPVEASELPNSDGREAAARRYMGG